MHLLALLCVPLTPTPAAQTFPALLTVPPANPPPTIDGLLDDPAWSRAAEATGFLLNTERTYAREQTWAKLCYDDRFLYLALRCAESKLVAASQQAHLFLARATGRDANVFGDDCVEVFLDPPGSGDYYQFAANAAGGTYESRGMDAKWNCDWPCLAKVGEGEWVVEMAIPLAALGGQAGAGEWSLNLCREEQPSHEISTWSGLQGAFHDPQQFGRMVLSQCPPLRALSLPRRDQPLRIAVDDLVMPLQLTLLTRAGDREKALSAPLIPGAHAEAELPLPRGVESAQWAVRTESGDTLCRSPWVDVGVSAHDLTLVLRPHGADVQVLLNGREVAPQAPGKYPLVLDPGYSTLGLDCRRRAPGWSVGVSLSSPGGTAPFADGWRAAVAPPAEWMSPDLDVSSWRAAVAAEGAISPHSPADHAVFRRTLFASSRREVFWPLQPDIYLPARSRQRLYPLLGESGAHVLAGFTYVLDLPRPLRIEASDRAHGSPVRITPRPPVKRRGMAYNSYALAADGPLGGGFQLLARWANADASEYTYQPVLDLGGTFDWQKLRGKATAPKWATQCGVLLLKWQNQGITGEIWFDDVTMAPAGSTQNIVPAGTFEEPVWQGKWFIEECRRSGTPGHCVHFNATPETVGVQHGVWVTEPHVSVSPGQTYTFTVWAKARKVGAPRRQPRACLLVNVGSPSGRELIGYTHWEAQGGNTTEVERPFPIHLLSPLPNRRPAQTRFIACYYGDLLENEACNRALAQTAARSGINCIYGSAGTAVTTYWSKGKPPEFVWPIPWEDYDAAPPAPDFLKQHPEAAAVQKDGKTSAGAICPTLILDEPNDFLPALEKWLTQAAKGSPYRHIDWDHEFPVWQDDSICFDERCLRAFRKFAGLADDVLLTRETVIADHKAEWIRFRCSQNARMAGKLREIVRAADPTIVFSVYSGFQQDFTRETYGVDWEMMAPNLDLGIAGYNGGRGILGQTVSALGKVPFIAGEMYHENDRTAQYALPKPSTWRLRLLRALLNGGGNGVLVWWLPVLDGGGFWGLSQVAALVHDFEPFFTHLDRHDELVESSPPLTPNDLAVLVHGDQRLIICMNGSASKLDVRLTNRDLPAGAVARLWPGKKAEPDARVLTATIEPEGIRAWSVKPTRPAH